MYGDDDYSKSDSRPLSFLASASAESIEGGTSYVDAKKSTRTRPPPTVTGTLERKAHTSPAMLQTQRRNSLEKSPNQNQLSPSLSLRERKNSDPANAQFPLNDIDYESDPTAIAQELNNLQALRRMSMDVGQASDPDLPSFQGVSLMPTVAPTGEENEDDPSRLFWVPARVHPELAPMEFKTFLENRVTSIKRRSGEQTLQSPDGLDPAGSGGSLRRKKSMLSRQIDNRGGRGAIGYKDGAEQIGRKKSQLANRSLDLKISDLQELDELVKDPSEVMQRLSLEGQSGEGEPGEDVPILPQAPGIGLRRSTRTTYRRGSVRKESRVPYSQRAGSIRDAETEGEEPLDASPTSSGFPLSKVQSEPANAENFSRPSRGGRRAQTQLRGGPVTLSDAPVPAMDDNDYEEASFDETPAPQTGSLSRSGSFPRNETPVPRIVETPPPQEEVAQEPSPPIQSQFPQRTSSQTPPPAFQKPPSPEPPSPDPPARSSKRPGFDRQMPSQPTVPRIATSSPSQTLNDMAQNPSPLPGGSVRTDTLTFIPTLDEKKSDDKKSDKKSKKDELDSPSSKKPGWGWFKGDDKKEKKKEDDQKKAKSKAVDKAHDNARLDLLQSTMETAPRGRESLLLDRESFENKLPEDRKKDGRKADSKKEKDGIFSSLFGGKKKSDRDSGGKKGSSLRTLSPEPPHRQLKPDVDYSWTRFSILEERAIYRMAHIKLANPRRALYSQVLLSNFMYSYLAKVQQMHPQMQIPQSAAQKKADAERRRREAEQRQREEDAQRQENGGDQYRYDYHQGIAQYAEPQQGSKSEGVAYVDDSQIYDHDHQEEDYGQGSYRPQSRTSHNTENGYMDQNQQYRQQGNEYYYGDENDDHDEDDMW